MSELTEWFATAECLVCGARVTRLEAPLHAEDHAQRGELTTTPPPNPSTTATCACGCPADMHIGEIGCPCALPGEPPCATEGDD